MSGWRQASLFWQIYCEFLVSINFCILSLFFVNGPHALYVNRVLYAQQAVLNVLHVFN